MPENDQPWEWSDQTFWQRHVQHAKASRPGEMLSSHVHPEQAQEVMRALRAAGVEAHIEPGARPYTREEKEVVEFFVGTYPLQARWNVVRGARVVLSPYGTRRPEIRVRSYLRRRFVKHLQHPPSYCLCRKSKMVDRARRGLLRRLK